MRIEMEKGSSRACIIILYVTGMLFLFGSIGAAIYVGEQPSWMIYLIPVACCGAMIGIFFVALSAMVCRRKNVDSAVAKKLKLSADQTDNSHNNHSRSQNKTNKGDTKEPARREDSLQTSMLTEAMKNGKFVHVDSTDASLSKSGDKGGRRKQPLTSSPKNGLTKSTGSLSNTEKSTKDQFPRSGSEDYLRRDRNVATGTLGTTTLGLSVNDVDFDGPIYTQPIPRHERYRDMSLTTFKQISKSPLRNEIKLSSLMKPVINTTAVQPDRSVSTPDISSQQSDPAPNQKRPKRTRNRHEPSQSPHPAPVKEVNLKAKPKHYGVPLPGMLHGQQLSSNYRSSPEISHTSSSPERVSSATSSNAPRSQNRHTPPSPTTTDASTFKMSGNQPSSSSVETFRHNALPKIIKTDDNPEKRLPKTIHHSESYSSQNDAIYYAIEDTVSCASLSPEDPLMTSSGSSNRFSTFNVNPSPKSQSRSVAFDEYNIVGLPSDYIPARKKEQSNEVPLIKSLQKQVHNYYTVPVGRPYPSPKIPQQGKGATYGQERTSPQNNGNASDEERQTYSSQQSLISNDGKQAPVYVFQDSKTLLETDI